MKHLINSDTILIRHSIVCGKSIIVNYRTDTNIKYKQIKYKKIK